MIKNFLNWLVAPKAPIPEKKYTTPVHPTHSVSVDLGEIEKTEVVRLFRNAALPEKRLNEVQDDYYDDKLGMTLKMASEGLLFSGELRLATLPEVLSGAHTLAQLKEKCSKLNLKTTGKKAVLADRLAENLPNHELAHWKSMRFLIASQSGLELLNKQKQNLIEAQFASLKLLQHGKFEESANLVCRYEDAQFMPRGIGVNWKKAGKRLTREVKQIFNAKPKFHMQRFKGVSDDVRLFAALSQLWGTDRLKPVLTRFDPEFDIDAVALPSRMLISFVNSNERVKQIKNSARKTGEEPKFKVLAVEDQNTSCLACLDDNGKVYALSEMPEIPHEFCECEIGCRCTTIVTPTAWTVS